jgi:hypothetical protein
MTAPLIPIYSDTVPRRTQSPTDFANNADDWLSYQSPLAVKYNDLAEYIDALAVVVDTDATEAQQSAVSSQQSAAISNTSANFKGLWGDLTGAANIPYSVLHEGVYWQLLNNLASVQSSEPVVSNSDWSRISSTPWDIITAAGTSFVNSYELVLTATDITRTLPTFSAGQFLVINNSPQSDGNVTIPATGITIYAKSGVLNSGDNLILRAGETVNIAADSATIARIL